MKAVKLLRCEYAGRYGQCTRRGRWTWEDDSMKIHHVCTQHRNTMVPKQTHDISGIPLCSGDIDTILCNCYRYTCTFRKTGSILKTAPVNKGKGIHV